MTLHHIVLIILCHIALSYAGAGAGKIAGAYASRLVARAVHHRWNMNPRPQPQKFSELVFLIWFC